VLFFWNRGQRNRLTRSFMRTQVVIIGGGPAVIEQITMDLLDEPASALGCTPTAGQRRNRRHVRCVPILLQKSPLVRPISKNRQY
jgi:hypothetical protein